MPRGCKRSAAKLIAVILSLSALLNAREARGKSLRRSIKNTLAVDGGAPSPFPYPIVSGTGGDGGNCPYPECPTDNSMEMTDASPCCAYSYSFHTNGEPHGGQPVQCPYGPIGSVTYTLAAGAVCAGGSQPNNCGPGNNYGWLACDVGPIPIVGSMSDQRLATSSNWGIPVTCPPGLILTGACMSSEDTQCCTQTYTKMKEDSVNNPCPNRPQVGLGSNPGDVFAIATCSAIDSHNSDGSGYFVYPGPEVEGTSGTRRYSGVCRTHNEQSGGSTTIWPVATGFCKSGSKANCGGVVSKTECAILKFISTASPSRSPTTEPTSSPTTEEFDVLLTDWPRLNTTIMGSLSNIGYLDRFQPGGTCETCSLDLDFLEAVNKSITFALAYETAAPQLAMAAFSFLVYEALNTLTVLGSTGFVPNLPGNMEQTEVAVELRIEALEFVASRSEALSQRYTVISSRQVPHWTAAMRALGNAASEAHSFLTPPAIMKVPELTISQYYEQYQATFSTVYSTVDIKQATCDTDALITTLAQDVLGSSIKSIGTQIESLQNKIAELSASLVAAVGGMQNSYLKIQSISGQMKSARDEAKKAAEVYMAIEIATVAFDMASAAADFLGGEGASEAEAENEEVKEGQTMIAIAEDATSVWNRMKGKVHELNEVFKAGYEGSKGIKGALAGTLNILTKLTKDVLTSHKLDDLISKLLDLKATWDEREDVFSGLNEAATGSDSIDSLRTFGQNASKFTSGYWQDYVAQGSEGIGSFIDGSTGAEASDKMYEYEQLLRAQAAYGLDLSNYAVQVANDAAEIKLLTSTMDSNQKTQNAAQVDLQEWNSGNVGPATANLFMPATDDASRGYAEHFRPILDVVGHSYWQQTISTTVVASFNTLYSLSRKICQAAKYEDFLWENPPNPEVESALTAVCTDQSGFFLTPIYSSRFQSCTKWRVLLSTLNSYGPSNGPLQTLYDAYETAIGAVQTVQQVTPQWVMISSPPCIYELNKKCPEADATPTRSCRRSKYKYYSPELLCMNETIADTPNCSAITGFENCTDTAGCSMKFQPCTGYACAELANGTRVKGVQKPKMLCKDLHQPVSLAPAIYNLTEFRETATIKFTIPICNRSSTDAWSTGRACQYWDRVAGLRFKAFQVFLLKVCKKDECKGKAEGKAELVYFEENESVLAQLELGAMTYQSYAGGVVKPFIFPTNDPMLGLKQFEYSTHTGGCKGALASALGQQICLFGNSWSAGNYIHPTGESNAPEQDNGVIYPGVYSSYTLTFEFYGSASTKERILSQTERLLFIPGTSSAFMV